MNKSIRFALFFALLSLAATANSQDSIEMPIGAASSYLNQSYPGTTPEIFAQPYLTKDCGIYANVTFHPDLHMVCWTPNSSNDSLYKRGLYIGERKSGQWMPYEEIRFLNADYGHRSPFFCSATSSMEMRYSGPPSHRMLTIYYLPEYIPEDPQTHESFPFM